MHALARTSGRIHRTCRRRTLSAAYRLLLRRSPGCARHGRIAFVGNGITTCSLPADSLPLALRGALCTLRRARTPSRSSRRRRTLPWSRRSCLRVRRFRGNARAGALLRAGRRASWTRTRRRCAARARGCRLRRWHAFRSSWAGCLAAGRTGCLAVGRTGCGSRVICMRGRPA